MYWVSKWEIARKFTRKREFKENSRRSVERCSHTLLIQFQYYLVSVLPPDFLLEPRKVKKKKG